MTYKEVLKSRLIVLAGIYLLISVTQAKYSGGSGEPNNPYQIATVSDWNDLMNISSDWNKRFIMTADVNLQGITLYPVGSSGEDFNGVFDGNGHIIRNANMINCLNYLGAKLCILKVNR